MVRRFSHFSLSVLVLSGCAASKDLLIDEGRGEGSSFDIIGTASSPTTPFTETPFVEDPGAALADVDVSVRYEGFREVAEVEVVAFDDRSCDGFDSEIPAPYASAIVPLDQEHRLADVEIGAEISIWAIGVNADGHAAAARCADVAVDGSKAVVIDIEDIASIESGTYALEEVFDVTEGFSGSLDVLLEVLDGLATDPGGYLIDLAFDSAGFPEWARFAIQGVRQLASTILEQAFGFIPMPLASVAEIGAEIEGALSAFTLESRLTLVDNGPSTYEVVAARVPTSDGDFTDIDIETAPSEIDVSRAEGDAMVLGEHTLSLPLAQIAETVIRESYLARMPESPESIADLIASRAQCDSIGEGRVIGRVFRSALEQACNVGARIAGERIESRLSNLANYDTLTLSGSGIVVDEDNDYMAERFEGRADAIWSGPSGVLELDGSRSGIRQEVASETVIDRIRSAASR